MFGINNDFLGFPSTPLSCIKLIGGNGFGTSYTTIRRFTTIEYSKGKAITIHQSPELGDSFTINEDGTYCISYTDACSSATTIGVSKNLTSSESAGSIITLATSITTLPKVLTVVAFTAGKYDTATALVPLKRGDKLVAHSDGGPNALPTMFQIVQVGR